MRKLVIGIALLAALGVARAKAEATGPPAGLIEGQANASTTAAGLTNFTGTAPRPHDLRRHARVKFAKEQFGGEYTGKIRLVA